MKNFLNEIKVQSRATREVMFGLCLVITVSAVGMVWFRSTEEKLFVTLNPDAEEQEKFFAQREGGEETIFANLGLTLSNVQASIGGLFNIFGSSESEVKIDEGEESSPYILPISKDR